MSLPRIKIPLFDAVIPSTKDKIKYRPFLVKEEKILLMAAAGESKKEMITSLKQIVNNCVTLNSGKKLNVDTLTTFDFEYLFLKIRSKSVDNVVTLRYLDHEDDKTYEFKVELDKIELLYPEEQGLEKIDIGDGYTLVMKYPTVDMLFDEDQDDINGSYETIKKCMDKLYDENSVYSVHSSTPEELEEFIDNLTPTTIEKINKFFNSMPKLYHKIEYTNSKGTERVIELSTLDDFFTLD